MAVHRGGRVDDSQGDAAGGDRGAEPLGARFRAEPVRRFADAVRLCSGKKERQLPAGSILARCGPKTRSWPSPPPSLPPSTKCSRWDVVSGPINASAGPSRRRRERQRKRFGPIARRRQKCFGLTEILKSEKFSDLREELVHSHVVQRVI